MARLLKVEIPQAWIRLTMIGTHVALLWHDCHSERVFMDDDSGEFLVASVHALD